ncbi:MAG: hypothetical protein JW873_03025 [Candidatus Saganbacteria bacterium]|nr:hypothetical protein [Candidatus Saganbacteria bacterium]
MINVIDLVVVALVLFYLLKNAGGLIKTARNLIVVLLVIIVFGVAARLLLNSAIISGEARKTLEDAYFVRLSYALIAGGYPVIRDGAPRVDSFIKEKIITATAEAKPELPRPEQFIPAGFTSRPKSK